MSTAPPEAPATPGAELAALYPTSVSHTIGADTVAVRPLTLRKISAIAGVLERIAGDDHVADLNIAKLAARNMADLAEMIEIATGLPRDKVLDAEDPAQALELAFAVYQVNRDFFVRRLVPILTKAGDLVPASWLGDGPTSSPTFSDEASPTPAS